ncbi:MAG: 23S rRNA (pseudouridine(1915)-N(3))-methyltransferase RlmH [Pseudomonadota bacterium]
MKLRLIAAGTRMPGWVTQGFEDYRKRLPPQLKLELVEIEVAHRGKNADIARLKSAEAQSLLRAVRDDDRVIVFDECGEKRSTVEWANALKQWMQDGRDVALLIGGPDGLAPEILQRAEKRWSLSPMTLPHALVRVLVAEQLYRAWSLLSNHPYHRA